jgi:hypothetical protein
MEIGNPAAGGPVAAGSAPLPRYRRVPQAPIFSLQERDIRILEDLADFRLLTTSQLEALRRSDPDPKGRFVSRLPLTRRLKLLYHHSYVGRIARPLAQGSLEPVYLLDREGSRVLRRRHGEVPGRALGSVPRGKLPKSSALEHLLGLSQVRVALTVACRRSVPTSSFPYRVELGGWWPGDAVKFSVALPLPGERRRSVRLIPDGAFVLRVQPSFARGEKWTRLFYFVEVDQATEPLKTLADKCHAYYAYWQSGGFAHDWNLPAQVAFRVLFVVPSARRAETLREAIRQLPRGRNLFWCATAEQIRPERQLATVWQDCEGAVWSLLGQRGT